MREMAERNDLDPTSGARRSSTGPRHRSSGADGEHHQLDDWRGHFRYSGDRGARARSGRAAGICLLRDCDGVVRHLFRDCRQPRFVHRRTLRVCRSRVRALRRISRRHALFSHRAWRRRGRRECAREFNRARCTVSRKSRDADRRDARRLRLARFDQRPRRARRRWCSHDDHDRETSPVAALHLRRNLLYSTRNSHVAGVARS